MDILVAIALFVLGTILGSFGSVIMLRLGRSFDRETIKSILVGFSRCPDCKKRLKATNLIPIASYFWQGGKCEYCGKKISSIYPTIEILSGIILAATFFVVKYVFFYYIPESIYINTLIFWLIVNFLLIILIIYDARYMELHQVVRWKLLIASLIVQFFANYTHLGNYQEAFVGSIFFGGFYVLLYYGSIWYLKLKYKKDMEGIGRGDVMLAFALGTFVPFLSTYGAIQYSIPNTLKLLFLFVTISSIVGLLYYILQLLLNKTFLKKISTESHPKIAFIPAMIVAFWILLARGGSLIRLLFF